ncbi:hypothetical protein K3495_g12405 [Podosphaera aphanis]|nr:hypothetical protein K3495_g12405 [Podosphaera aphanis]
MATAQNSSGDEMEITTSTDIDLASQPRLDSSIWASQSNNKNITTKTNQPNIKTTGSIAKNKTPTKGGSSKVGKVTKPKLKKKTSSPPPIAKFNNIDLSNDPITSLDFTPGPTQFMEPKTPKKRKDHYV